MSRNWPRFFLPVAAVVSFLLVSGPHLRGQRKRNEEPKTQVLPLPPELPMALAVDTNSIDFHISPLLRTGGLAAQIRQSLNDLIRDTHGETIIKLRAFVAGAGDARRVQAEVAQLFTEKKLPLPALTILQVGALGDEAAQVVIEAVVDTRKVVNPSGLAFISGQSGSTFRAAVDHMRESVSTASLAADHVLTSTCFTSRIDNYEAARGAIQSYFPNSAINVVQAVRDPLNDATICEAVAQLSQPSTDDPLIILKQARVSLVSAHQLVFTGLQLSFGSYLDDAHEAFVRLHRAASALQPVEAPVEVNAFALDAYGGSALRKTTSVPPFVFTVQNIEGLPAIDASAGIEAVMAPKVETPVMH